MFDTLDKFSQPFIVICRDFNMIMSPNKDRHVLFLSKTPSNSDHLSKSFRKLIRTKNLLDIWRIKHPTHKQYTFYSHPHKLYFRLDNFFISSPLLTSTVSSGMNPVSWSDHSSVHLDIALSSASPRTCHWHLNGTLLRIPETREHLSNSLVEYF